MKLTNNLVIMDTIKPCKPNKPLTRTYTEQTSQDHMVYFTEGGNYISHTNKFIIKFNTSLIFTYHCLCTLSL